MANFNEEALRQLKDIAESSQLNWKGWAISERVVSTDYFRLGLEADSCISNIYLNGSETEFARVPLSASAEISVWFLGKDGDEILSPSYYHVKVILCASSNHGDTVFAKEVRVDCRHFKEAWQLVIDMLAYSSIEEAQAHIMRQINSECLVF